MEQLSSEALYSSEGKKFYKVNKDIGRHIVSLCILQYSRINILCKIQVKIRNIFLLKQTYYGTIILIL